MGVGGEEVDPFFGEEIVSHLLGGLAHAAGDGVAGDLDEDAAAHPLGEAGRVLLESGIALGVGEDGGEAGELELVEGFREGAGDAVVGDLDHEIAEAVDGELGGLLLGFEDVVVGEMEVAAEAYFDGDGFGVEAALQLGCFGGVFLGKEGVGSVGVGGADDVGDAVFGAMLWPWRWRCRCLWRRRPGPRGDDGGCQPQWSAYHRGFSAAAASELAMARKSLRPSAEPRRDSLERSGWGIMPRTLRPSLRMPAMLSSEPLGLAAGVISPLGLA